MASQVILGARIHAGMTRVLERMGFDAYVSLLNDDGIPATLPDGTRVAELKLRVKKGLYTLEMLRRSLCEVRRGGGGAYGCFDAVVIQMHPPFIPVPRESCRPENNYS
jgi:hypothetical protein